MKLITGKINLSKINKNNLFKSEETGNIYLDIKIMIKAEKDQYGNNGFISQQFQKENRKDANGEYINTPILGNVRTFTPDEIVPTKENELPEDDLPF